MQTNSKTKESYQIITDLTRNHNGFHHIGTSESNADAILRKDKTDAIISAELNIQKGDYIVFSIDHNPFHKISDKVYEVTFVSYVPKSSPAYGCGQVALSIRLIPKLRYQKADCNSSYIEDCIIEKKDTTHATT